MNGDDSPELTQISGRDSENNDIHVEQCAYPEIKPLFLVLVSDAESLLTHQLLGELDRDEFKKSTDLRLQRIEKREHPFAEWRELRRYQAETSVMLAEEATKWPVRQPVVLVYASSLQDPQNVARALRTGVILHGALTLGQPPAWGCFSTDAPLVFSITPDTKATGNRGPALATAVEAVIYRELCDRMLYRRWLGDSIVVSATGLDAGHDGEILSRDDELLALYKIHRGMLPASVGGAAAVTHCIASAVSYFIDGSRGDQTSLFGTTMLDIPAMAETLYGSSEPSVCGIVSRLTRCAKFQADLSPIQQEEPLLCGDLASQDKLTLLLPYITDSTGVLATPRPGHRRQDTPHEALHALLSDSITKTSGVTPRLVMQTQAAPVAWLAAQAASLACGVPLVSERDAMFSNAVQSVPVSNPSPIQTTQEWPVLPAYPLWRKQYSGAILASIIQDGELFFWFGDADPIEVAGKGKTQISVSPPLQPVEHTGIVVLRGEMEPCTYTEATARALLPVTKDVAAKAAQTFSQPSPPQNSVISIDTEYSYSHGVLRRDGSGISFISRRRLDPGLWGGLLGLPQGISFSVSDQDAVIHWMNTDIHMCAEFLRVEIHSDPCCVLRFSGDRLCFRCGSREFSADLRLPLEQLSEDAWKGPTGRWPSAAVTDSSGLSIGAYPDRTELSLMHLFAHWTPQCLFLTDGVHSVCWNGRQCAIGVEDEGGALDGASLTADTMRRFRRALDGFSATGIAVLTLGDGWQWEKDVKAALEALVSTPATPCPSAPGESASVPSLVLGPARAVWPSPERLPLHQKLQEIWAAPSKARRAMVTPELIDSLSPPKPHLESDSAVQSATLLVPVAPGTTLRPSYWQRDRSLIMWGADEEQAIGCWPRQPVTVPHIMAPSREDILVQLPRRNTVSSPLPPPLIRLSGERAMAAVIGGTRPIPPEFPDKPDMLVTLVQSPDSDLIQRIEREKSRLDSAASYSRRLNSRIGELGLAVFNGEKQAIEDYEEFPDQVQSAEQLIIEKEADETYTLFEAVRRQAESTRDSVTAIKERVTASRRSSRTQLLRQNQLPSLKQHMQPPLEDGPEIFDFAKFLTSFAWTDVELFNAFARLRRDEDALPLTSTNVPARVSAFRKLFQLAQPRNMSKQPHFSKDIPEKSLQALPGAIALLCRLLPIEQTDTSLGDSLASIGIFFTCMAGSIEWNNTRIKRCLDYAATGNGVSESAAYAEGKMRAARVQEVLVCVKECLRALAGALLEGIQQAPPCDSDDGPQLSPTLMSVASAVLDGISVVQRVSQLDTDIQRALLETVVILARATASSNSVLTRSVWVKAPETAGTGDHFRGLASRGFSQALARLGGPIACYADMCAGGSVSSLIDHLERLCVQLADLCPETPRNSLLLGLALETEWLASMKREDVGPDASRRLVQVLDHTVDVALAAPAVWLYGIDERVLPGVGGAGLVGYGVTKEAAADGRAAHQAWQLACSVLRTLRHLNCDEETLDSVFSATFEKCAQPMVLQTAGELLAAQGSPCQLTERGVTLLRAEYVYPGKLCAQLLSFWRAALDAAQGNELSVTGQRLLKAALTELEGQCDDDTSARALCGLAFLLEERRARALLIYDDLDRAGALLLDPRFSQHSAFAVRSSAQFALAAFVRRLTERGLSSRTRVALSSLPAVLPRFSARLTGALAPLAAKYLPCAASLVSGTQREAANPALALFCLSAFPSTSGGDVPSSCAEWYADLLCGLVASLSLPDGRLRRSAACVLGTLSRLHCDQLPLARVVEELAAVLAEKPDNNALEGLALLHAREPLSFAENLRSRWMQIPTAMAALSQCGTCAMGSARPATEYYSAALGSVRPVRSIEYECGFMAAPLPGPGQFMAEKDLLRRLIAAPRTLDTNWGDEEGVLERAAPYLASSETRQPGSLSQPTIDSFATALQSLPAATQRRLAGTVLLARSAESVADFSPLSRLIPGDSAVACCVPLQLLETAPARKQ